MANDLNSLKNELYNAFNTAISREAACYRGHDKESAGAGYLQAAAKIAESIVKVEDALQQREENGSTRRSLDK